MSTIKCVVTNQTGEDCTSMKVTHRTGTYNNTKTQQNVKKEGTFEFQLDYTSSADHWDVLAVTASGETLKHDDKKCSIEDSDVSSGQPVRIIFHSRDAGWDVALPESSSCLGNHY